MTKISRPFQIALVAVVLLAAVYLVALRKHSSSSESSAPTPVASTATPSSAASAGTSASSSSSSASPSAGGSGSGSGTSTYKGSAPGVDGLTRAIQKARGAVSESEQNAKALQQKASSASASPEKLGSSATGAAAATGGTAAATHSAAKTQAASSAASAVKAKSKTSAPRTPVVKTVSGVPLLQARVEAELKHGKVAALLFWNPNGAVDKTVRRELQATARKLHGKLAISVARSSAVGSFGTFTRTVQVYGTPTILLINPAGKTASVTGLTDVFSLEQAVREIKHSK